MKLSILPLLSTATALHQQNLNLPSSIPLSSSLGQSLLSSARRLDGKDEDESAYTWMTSYSLKFQGCHAHTSLNLQGENNNKDQNNAMIQTVKMAHFRLCPTNSCQSWYGSGCSSNYADYVVDLETFAKSYIQSHRRTREYECQLYLMAQCDCQENDDRDDGFNRDYCEYDCYAGSSLYQDCVDRNPYEEEEEGNRRERRFEAERYMECKEFEREERDDDDDDADDTQYYIGPYCSEKGTEVYLGLYTDETCTTFADSAQGRTTYQALTAAELPYSTTSLITNDCVSCIEVEDLNRRQDEQRDQDDAYGNDAEDVDEVSEQCERLYESSGKCEMYLSSDITGAELKNSECSFIGGIQFTNSNGVVVDKRTARDNANVFIGVFAVAFVAMGAAVYQLRKKLVDAKKTPLIEKNDSQEDKPLDAATTA